MCLGSKPKINVQSPPVVEPSPPVEIAKISEELEAEKNPQEYRKKFGKRQFRIPLGTSGADNAGSGLKV